MDESAPDAVWKSVRQFKQMITKKFIIVTNSINQANHMYLSHYLSLEGTNYNSKFYHSLDPYKILMIPWYLKDLFQP